MARRSNYSGGKKPNAPKCPCGQSLATGAKTFIEGAWRCERCTYNHDHPDAQIARTPRPKPLPLQEEKLFEIPARDDR